jgi:hypothetical protein
MRSSYQQLIPCQWCHRATEIQLSNSVVALLTFSNRYRAFQCYDASVATAHAATSHDATIPTDVVCAPYAGNHHLHVVRRACVRSPSAAEVDDYDKPTRGLFDPPPTEIDRPLNVAHSA